ncbi:MAG: XdhC family protein [Pseudomonadota bacterium]
MEFVDNIFPTLSGYLNEKKRICIATLINVDGSSPRPVGSQIGVCEDGRYVGMITGGCAEKVIVAEAVAAIKAQENKTLRYGAGSPFIDVVLPCGSGIDVHFNASSANEIATAILAAGRQRETLWMTINKLSNDASITGEISALDESDFFYKAIEPDYRILSFGEGANLVSFCLLSKIAGFLPAPCSPDEDALAFLRARGVDGMQIHAGADFSEIPVDRLTAIVTLFHEHDWEIPILHRALNSEACYIGALGSQRTHAARLQELSDLAKTKRNVSEIHAPVGLDIGAQNPNEIAIAILSEIILHRRRRQP